MGERLRHRCGASADPPCGDNGSQSLHTYARIISVAGWRPRRSGGTQASHLDYQYVCRSWRKRGVFSGGSGRSAASRTAAPAASYEAKPARKGGGTDNPAPRVHETPAALFSRTMSRSTAAGARDGARCLNRSRPGTSIPPGAGGSPLTGSAWRWPEGFGRTDGPRFYRPRMRPQRTRPQFQ